MSASGLGLIVARCKFGEFENNLPSSMIFCRDVSRLEASDAVAEQIRDFLEGRTNGEDLLHALHDYVLDEPIPERMRALFRAGSAD
jgi:hypothetical protein